MGRACSTHERDENFGQKDHPNDLGVDGKLILEWILGT